MTLPQECLVGYEATALELQRGSGVSRYTEQLLNALVEYGAGWQLGGAGKIALAVIVAERASFHVTFPTADRASTA